MGWLAFCFAVVIIVQSGIIFYLIRTLVAQHWYILSITIKKPVPRRKPDAPAH